MIISNYWNSALRSLTKKKGFSAINIIGLAIGMAAALLILTYVAFEYSYDDMHSRPHLPRGSTFLRKRRTDG